MKIRKYLEKDWSRICHIHDLARLDELRGASLEDAFLPLEVASKNENIFEYDLLVAEHNGVVAGFIAYDEEEIAWLYVDPTLYRIGIGKALVNTVIEASSSAFTIEVLKGNSAALQFYLNAGFSMVETHSGVMPGNEKFDVTVHELCNAENA